MENPIVTLAGKEYEVPFLVPRQNRIVLPLIFEYGQPIKDFIAELESGKAKSFPSDQYAALLTIVYWGVIWPNDKTSKPDSIDEMAVSYSELLKAFGAVQWQTGLFIKPDESKVASSGEAKAEG